MPGTLRVPEPEIVWLSPNALSPDSVQSEPPASVMAVKPVMLEPSPLSVASWPTVPPVSSMVVTPRALASIVPVK